MSASVLARHLKVPANRITGIINERRAVTADTALRLARALGTSSDIWLGLQKRFDLRTAELKLGTKLRTIMPIPHG